MLIFSHFGSLQCILRGKKSKELTCLNKAKKRKKETFFVKRLDQCRRLEVREKARNVFLRWAYVCLTTRCNTTSIASSSSFFRFRSDFLAFSARISYFKFLRNLIKQLFHSRLLDIRLVIANSALRASLAIYHLISNAHSWNNC